MRNAAMAVLIGLCTVATEAVASGPVRLGQVPRSPENPPEVSPQPDRFFSQLLICCFI